MNSPSFYSSIVSFSPVFCFLLISPDSYHQLWLRVKCNRVLVNSGILLNTTLYYVNLCNRYLYGQLFSRLCNKLVSQAAYSDLCVYNQLNLFTPLYTECRNMVNIMIDQLPIYQLYFLLIHVANAYFFFTSFTFKTGTCFSHLNC